jgi:hypothetical protein
MAVGRRLGSAAEAVIGSELNERLFQLISVCRLGVKPGNNREASRSLGCLGTDGLRGVIWPGETTPGTSQAALRSLLGFLHVQGEMERPLASAVPSVACQRLVGLPKGLEPDQVRRLLASPPGTRCQPGVCFNP